MSVEPVSGGSTLEAVYRREAPRLSRALMAFTAGRGTLAEEAVAEAFSRALAEQERIRDPVAWLYRVAFRIAAAELPREGHPLTLIHYDGHRWSTDPATFTGKASQSMLAGVVAITHRRLGSWHHK